MRRFSNSSAQRNNWTRRASEPISGKRSQSRGRRTAQSPLETWIDYVADERGWETLQYVKSFVDLFDRVEVGRARRGEEESYEYSECDDCYCSPDQ